MTEELPTEEQLRSITDTVSGLREWAREYEQDKGYKLDPPLRAAIERLRLMVEAMVTAIARMLAEATQGRGAGGLELVRLVAELGQQTGAKARTVRKGNKRVQDGHKAVLAAVLRALEQAGPGSLREAQLRELRVEVGPVREAARQLLAAFHVAIASQATFSMQLAKAAARETVVERKTARIVKRVAEEMSQYISTLLPADAAGGTGRSGSSTLSVTGSLTGSLAPISVAEVLEAAERERAVAQRRRAAADQRVAEATEALGQVDGRLDAARREVREISHEISALERSENEDADIHKRALETANKVGERLWDLALLQCTLVVVLGDSSRLAMLYHCEPRSSTFCASAKAQVQCAKAMPSAYFSGAAHPLLPSSPLHYCKY